MAKNSGVKLGELKVDLKLNTEDIIKELKSVQREAKKATQAVKEWDTTYIEWLLNIAGKYGFILTATDEKSRAIGKTVAIINKARKEKLLIVVGSNAMVNYITPGNNPDKECISVPTLFNRRGFNFKDKYNGFLIDEGVSNKDIKEIIKITGLEFKGGFNNIFTSIK